MQRIEEHLAQGDLLSVPAKDQVNDLLFLSIVQQTQAAVLLRVGFIIIGMGCFHIVEPETIPNAQVMRKVDFCGNSPDHSVLSLKQTPPWHEECQKQNKADVR